VAILLHAYRLRVLVPASDGSVQYVSKALPTTWVAEALRSIMIRGAYPSLSVFLSACVWHSLSVCVQGCFTRCVCVLLGHRRGHVRVWRRCCLLRWLTCCGVCVGWCSLYVDAVCTGWSMDSYHVYMGFVVSSAWLLVFVIGAILSLRTRS